MGSYVGLDVSTRATAICVIDEAGNKVWEGSCATDPAIINAVVRRQAPDIVRAGLETGPLSVWLWHALNDLKLPIVCLHAKHAAAALSLQTNKTDRNDAAGLARLVRSGWYRPVAVKALETHKLRTMLVVRDQLVRTSTNVTNKIRGVLKTFGIVLGPSRGSVFKANVRRRLPKDDIIRPVVEGLLQVLETLQEQKREIDRRLNRFARNDQVCRVLTTAPGVGTVTAISFVTTIEDPKRFERSADVGAFLGLTPRRYQSGDVDFGGRISKCGDRMTRKLLFEAAHAIISRSGTSTPLKAWAQRVAARSGHWKARVALARKLAVILHRMWRDGTPFQVELAAS